MVFFHFSSCGYNYYLICVPAVDLRLLSVMVLPFTCIAVTTVIVVLILHHALAYVTFSILLFLFTAFCNADELLYHLSPIRI